MPKSLLDVHNKNAQKPKGISWEIPVSDFQSSSATVKGLTKEEKDRLAGEIESYLEKKQMEVKVQDPHPELRDLRPKAQPFLPREDFLKIPGQQKNNSTRKPLGSCLFAEAHMHGSRIPVLAAHFSPAHSFNDHASSGNVSSHDSGFSEGAADRGDLTQQKRKVITKKRSPTRRASAPKFGSSGNNGRKQAPGLKNSRSTKEDSTCALPKLKVESRDKVVKSPIVTRRRGVDRKREAARNIYNWFIYR
jgi:hypothetical protein